MPLSSSHIWIFRVTTLNMSRSKLAYIQYLTSMQGTSDMHIIIETEVDSIRGAMHPPTNFINLTHEELIMFHHVDKEFYRLLTMVL